MKTRSLLYCLFLLISIAQIKAQTITGTITDEDGEALIGVNIVESGTTNGTVTDFDGAYSINLQNAEAL